MENDSNQSAGTPASQTASALAGSSFNLGNPRVFVTGWLRIYGAVIRSNGTVKVGQQEDLDQIINSMWLDYDEQVRRHNASEMQKAPALRHLIRPFKESDMRKAIEELIEAQRLKALDDLVATIRCTGENLKPLETFVIGMTGTPQPEVVAVLAHFIWLAKRKMLGLPVVDHIMPIIKGKQGSGKSTAINLLLSVLTNVVLRMKVSDVGDDRQQMVFDKNFVIFTDEMERADKTDVETLKNQITTPYNSVRKLHTHLVRNVPQNCTFIGATNRPVAEQICDPTGMRRFFEIESLPKMDWLILNQIDYRLLWQGVDENKPNGYVDAHRAAIQKRQEFLKSEDEFDLFIQAHQIEHDPSPQGKVIKVEEVYDHYKDWAERFGYKPSNLNWFGRKMNARGVISEHRTVDGKKASYFTLKAVTPVRSNTDPVGNIVSVSKKGVRTYES